MWDSMILGAAIGVGVVILAMIYGATRKPNFTVPPRRHTIVRSPLPPAEAAARIKALSSRGYSLQKEDPAQGLVVLGDSMGFFSFGNFFPCFIRAAAGGSEIAVGIAPKVPQYGPVVTSKLNRIVSAVTEAVAKPA